MTRFSVMRIGMKQRRDRVLGGTIRCDQPCGREVDKNRDLQAIDWVNFGPNFGRIVFAAMRGLATRSQGHFQACSACAVSLDEGLGQQWRRFLALYPIESLMNQIVFKAQ